MWFVYYECQLLVIALRFKANVGLCSPEDGVATNWEMLGDEQPYWFPGDVLVFEQTVARDEEGAWNLGERLEGTSGVLE